MANPAEALSGALQQAAALGSTPKIRPYLRKMSIPREDQGYVDLSRSLVDTGRLGLGIDEDGLAVESGPAPGQRRHAHNRTTSVESQASVGSAYHKPNQPFTHPMKQTPRPYTPPTGVSHASSIHEDQTNDLSDATEDDLHPPPPAFRGQRSMSAAAAGLNHSTPLFQSHSASDFSLIAAQTASESHTNLSTLSGSGHSTTSKSGRPRRGTGRSTDILPSPSLGGRSDQGFHLSSRRSDLDPKSRDERIRAARRKFQEKEAHKERKAANKQRDSESSQTTAATPRRRRSSEFPPFIPVTTDPAPDEKRRKSPLSSETDFQARSYEDSRPANAASLPRHVYSATASRKRVAATRPSAAKSTAKPSESQWLRFSTWLQTRMLSCGGRRD